MKITYSTQKINSFGRINIVISGIDNFRALNIFDQMSGVDRLNLSKLQMEYRKEIWESVEKIWQTPGYEDIFLLDTVGKLEVGY